MTANLWDSKQPRDSSQEALADLSNVLSERCESCGLPKLAVGGLNDTDISYGRGELSATHRPPSRKLSIVCGGCGTSLVRWESLS